jgi:MFS family permease
MSLVSLFFNFFGLMTGAVFIPFLKRDFGASDALVGYALGIGAIGALVGSYLGGRLPANWPFGRIMIVAYVIDGAFFMPVAFTHNLAVAVFFLSLTNACVLLEVTQIVGWRTRITPQELVGRVFGVSRLVVLAGTVPGAIVGGILADRYDARLPIVISGLGYLAMALAIALFPAIRRETR